MNTELPISTLLDLEGNELPEFTQILTKQDLDRLETLNGYAKTQHVSVLRTSLTYEFRKMAEYWNKILWEQNANYRSNAQDIDQLGLMFPIQDDVVKSTTNYKSIYDQHL